METSYSYFNGLKGRKRIQFKCVIVAKREISHCEGFEFGAVRNPTLAIGSFMGPRTLWIHCKTPLSNHDALQLIESIQFQ